MKELLKLYDEIGDKITKRLDEFRSVWSNYGNNDIFGELTFCLLTPQSKARMCWDAVIKIKENNLIENGSSDQILQHLFGVRFKYKKAIYIIKAREACSKNGKIILKDIIKNHKNIFFSRDWLVENIIGIGFKEASHFLRNISFGSEIAILDRHILKCLVHYKVIDEIPKSISKKNYIEIESKMKIFSEKIKIPMDHLDYLFWYNGTKDIFK